MSKKLGMTAADHKTIGTALAGMAETSDSVLSLVAEAYPKSSPQYRAATRVAEAISSLRWDMEGAAHRERVHDALALYGLDDASLNAQSEED